VVEVKGRVLAATAVTGVLALSISGCLGDKAEEPFKDAGRTNHDNANPMDVVQGSDGFSNVGSKCDGYGGRLYVAYHGDGLYASIAAAPYAQLNPSDPCRNDTSGFAK